MLQLTKSLLAAVYHTSRVFVKSVRMTIAEEIELSRERAKTRYDAQRPTAQASCDCSVLPSLTEALLIIGVKDLRDRKDIEARYRHLLAANNQTHGGSFYLQSKIVRAKERLDYEFESESKRINERNACGRSEKP